MDTAVVDLKVAVKQGSNEMLNKAEKELETAIVDIEKAVQPTQMAQAATEKAPVAKVEPTVVAKASPQQTPVKPEVVAKADLEVITEVA